MGAVYGSVDIIRVRLSDADSNWFKANKIPYEFGRISAGKIEAESEDSALEGGEAKEVILGSGGKKRGAVFDDGPDAGLVGDKKGAGTAPSYGLGKGLD